MTTSCKSEEIKPLLITPRPFYGESQKGFLQRVAERNGYPSPNFYLRYLGICEKRQLMVNSDIDLLAKGLNCKDIDLERIHFKKSSIDSARSRKIQLLGHDITLTHLNMKEVKICPLCIKETGFISLFGHIKMAIGCPKHNVVLIEKCNDCGKSIKANSGELLQCKCGSDFSKYELENTNNNLNMMMKVLWKKLHYDPLDTGEFNNIGFPIEHFSRISLNALLGIIFRLIKQLVDDSVLNTLSISNERDKIVTVCDSFAHWPNNFRGFLLSIISPKLDDFNDKSLQQIHKISSTIFKPSIPEDEVEFLKEASKETYKHFLSSEKDIKEYEIRRFFGFEHSETNSYYSTLEQVSNILNVIPSMARKMVKLGVIKEHSYSFRGKINSFYSITSETPRTKPGDGLTVSKAAKIIGIAVSVLKILRANGIYQVKRIADKLESYHSEDVNDFRLRLQNTMSNIDRSMVIPKNGIKFDEILKVKNFDVSLKAQLIADVLNRRIVVDSKLGNSISDIVISKATLNTWKRAHRHRPKADG